MFSKINHVAIVSENYAKSALFYQAVFGMRTSDKTQTSRAQTVGDGYVGLNINPRRAGRSAGLDHFGIEVEDAETAFERMRRKYPTVKWLQRPSNRPFAGVSTHDPDGNMFDISQKTMTNRTSVYRDQEGNGEVNARHIDHVALRTMRPDAMAEFYRDVFELAPSEQGRRRPQPLPDRRAYDAGHHALGHHRLRRHRHHHRRHGPYRLQGRKRRRSSRKTSSASPPTTRCWRPPRSAPAPKARNCSNCFAAPARSASTIWPIATGF